VFFTDEAWFHLSSYVNSQNYRTWRTENPHNFTETPLHPQKIGVWCAISRRRIIGFLFFEISINAEAYQKLIQQFIALLKVSTTSILLKAKILAEENKIENFIKPTHHGHLGS
jgi:penicillin-binding protein-related factor A (putative recombinase)